MAAQPVVGTAITTDELANLKILNMDPKIHQTNRRNTPYSSYLFNNRMGREDTGGWTYLTYDLEHPPHVFNVGAAAAAADTTVHIVGAANWITVGDTFLHAVNGSMERVVVTATPSADASVAVGRGAGGTTPNAWAKNDKLVYLGNALEEHQDGSPVPREAKPVETTFALQNMRLSVSTSKPNEHTKKRYGSYRSLQQKLRMDRYKQGIEMAGLFGPSNTAGDLYTGPDNSSPVYSATGLDSFITRNRTMIEEWTIPMFENAMQRAWQYHDGNWAYLCSPRIYRKINNLCRKDLIPSENSKSWGKKTYTLITSWGEVEIVVEPLLAFGALAGYGVGVPKPIEEYSQILVWDGDGLGSAIHWQFDVLKDDAGTAYKDVLSGYWGFAHREQDRFFVTFGTER